MTPIEDAYVTTFRSSDIEYTNGTKIDDPQFGETNSSTVCKNINIIWDVLKQPRHVGCCFCTVLQEFSSVCLEIIIQ